MLGSAVPSSVCPAILTLQLPSNPFRWLCSHSQHPGGSRFLSWSLCCERVVSHWANDFRYQVKVRNTVLKWSVLSQGRLSNHEVKKREEFPCLGDEEAHLVWHMRLFQAGGKSAQDFCQISAVFLGRIRISRTCWLLSVTYSCLRPFL